MSQRRSSQTLQRIRAHVVIAALFFGGMAGVVSALTFALMKSIQQFIWVETTSTFTAFFIILTGGVLITLLTWVQKTRLPSLSDTGGEIFSPHARSSMRQHLLLTACIAVVTVAFGGPLGPEAGLLTVVSTSGMLVSSRIAQTAQEYARMNESAQAAALAGLYGSAPGAAVFSVDDVSKSRLPTWAAALSGFLAFWGLLGVLNIESHPLHLPPIQELNIQSLAFATPVALCAGIAGCLFFVINHYMRQLANRIAERFTRWGMMLTGSLLLAFLLAWVPILRFSGHEEINALPELAAQGGVALLLGVMLMKIAASALALASGWLGGVYFPLAFVGAAAGVAGSLLIPGLDASLAIIVGLVTATAVALNKPLAALLIAAFVFPEAAPACVFASAIGLIFLQFLPRHFLASSH